MLEKIKALLDSLENNHFILAFGGVVGALLGALQKKMKFVPALASMFTGGTCAAVLGPWIVHILGDSDDPAIFSAVGFFIGLLIKEVTEIVFKVLDDLEGNPAFITDWIRRKVRNKDNNQ